MQCNQVIHSSMKYTAKQIFPINALGIGFILGVVDSEKSAESHLRKRRGQEQRLLMGSIV